MDAHQSVDQSKGGTEEVRFRQEVWLRRSLRFADGGCPHMNLIQEEICVRHALQAQD